MEKAKRALRERCKDLLTKIGIFQSKVYATIPLSRYILSIPYALPIEHLILAERPYRINIFPYAASAMSYDPRYSDTTPAVHFLALDISNANADISYLTARDWFRDSWKYLTRGILLLNVCTTCGFMENKSERERVYMEEFIRDMLLTSFLVSETKVHIYALGSPARHSASRMRSSLHSFKNLIVIHECKNPASFKHKLGDSMSPEFTLGSKAVTKLLSSVVRTTFNCRKELTESSYMSMASGAMELDRMIERGNNVRDSFKEITAFFKNSNEVSVDKNDKIFSRAAEEMQEFIFAMSDMKIRTLFLNEREPKGTSKPAYFGHRTAYNSSNYSRGSSSRVSSTPVSGRKQKLSFGDDDVLEENETKEEYVPTTATITPQTPTPSAVHHDATATNKSNRRISIGFGDTSDTDIETPPTPSGTGQLNVQMSRREIEDMSQISDFVDPANNSNTIDPAITEFIQEAIRAGRAVNNPAKQLLSIIREIHMNTSMPSVAKCIGYEDASDPDVTSNIMQWVLKNVV